MVTKFPVKGSGWYFSLEKTHPKQQVTHKIEVGAWFATGSFIEVCPHGA
jgi:hypothetical protein